MSVFSVTLCFVVFGATGWSPADAAVPEAGALASPWTLALDAGPGACRRRTVGLAPWSLESGCAGLE